MWSRFNCSSQINRLLVDACLDGSAAEDIPLSEGMIDSLTYTAAGVTTVPAIHCLVPQQLVLDHALLTESMAALLLRAWTLSTADPAMS